MLNTVQEDKKHKKAFITYSWRKLPWTKNKRCDELSSKNPISIFIHTTLHSTALLLAVFMLTILWDINLKSWCSLSHCYENEWLL